MKRFYFSLFFFFIFALAISGCKRKQEQSNATLDAASLVTPNPQMISINITTEPQTLDPRKMRALNDINLSKMFFEGLTRVGKNKEPILALAETIAISDDFKTYTIKLKSSKWSNDTPVTAQDFIYAWKSSLSPDFSSPNAHMLYVIKNGAAIKTGKLPSSLLGAEAIDDSTLRIELISPIPYFLELLSHPIFLPVHAKVDRLNPDWAKNSTSFVGNGPFLLKEWKHHNYIEACKNKTYWDSDAVHLSEIKLMMCSADTGLKLFDSNELSWNGSPFSIIPADARAALKESHSLKQISNLATHWIRINTDSTPLNSKKMRQALALAIDRQTLIDHVMQGNQIMTTSIVPTAMELTSKPYFKDGNIEQALSYFQEALQEQEINYEDFPSIKLLYASSGDIRPRLAQALQDQWQKAFGISIELEGVDSQIFFDRVAKCDYDLSIGSWYADFNDPINFLEVFKTKSVGTNNTNWENSDYTKLLEQSYYCHEKEKRTELLRKSEQILIDAMPVIPLYNASMLYVKDDHLHDVILTPMGTIDFKWAHLVPKTQSDSPSLER